MATKEKLPEIIHEVIENNEVRYEKITDRQQMAIARQIDHEYNLCYKYNDSKRKSQLARLKLYNNQMRDPSLVGDPLMFTVFNTIHASLWNDRLAATWEGRGGEGDEDTEENLNALSNFDYDVMQKAEADYEWNWDAEFFGRGLLMLMEFDRREGYNAPVPEVIDPTTFMRDPRAASVNGDMKGRGAMRFGGRELGLTYHELLKNKAYFNCEFLQKDKDIQSTIDETRQERRSAQGLTSYDKDEETLDRKKNYEFRLLEWVTHINGKKYLVTLGNNRSLLVRIQKLKDQDRWPIIDRSIWPISHDWDGVSIPDLTEDKQRFRSVLLNLTGRVAKADAMGRFAYDRRKIKNYADLDFSNLKYIGVEGDPRTAIFPMTGANTMAYVREIYELLDVATQKATASPELKQSGTQKGAQTLGELELIAGYSDSRYSMSARLYGLSEARFWRQWYRLYKQYFKEDIDEKIVRIQGATAPTWKTLMRDNIVAQVDPDVKIESRAVSEAKQLRDRQSFTGFATLAIQDPEANRRFILKKLGRYQGMTKEEVDLAFPQTVDEIQAEEENIQLNAGKLPPISVQDDHKTHIWIHSKATQNAESLAHIRKHKQAMVMKRNLPELFPPQVSPFGGGSTAPEQTMTSPKPAATPRSTGFATPQ